jgi:uncharacterized protein
MSITITPLYAALLALLYVYLSIRVISMRRGERISLGDGGSEEMQRRIRAHGNFAEYVPMVLILMALAELQNRPALGLHLIGGCLLVGRIAHAAGVSTGYLRARVIGMFLTFVALIISALSNLGLGTWLAGLAG